LTGPRDPKLRLSLEDVCRCNAHVIVVLKGCADKILEFLVLENFPPFLVTEGSR
jgi:hypothetical protein